LPGRATAALQHLGETLADGGELAAELSQWITPEELQAARDRVELLIEHDVHPYPPADWPAVPWPPV
ncbi:MAG TPA: phosphatidylinositol kinase, partial [Streptosporangiaceae bacterium]|nr:phosphatidylinositol kinase [Streptosporangiaceae bacterium]